MLTSTITRVQQTQTLVLALTQIATRLLLVVTLMYSLTWVSRQDQPLVEVALILKAAMAVTLTPQVALEEIQVLARRWGTPQRVLSQ